MVRAYLIVVLCWVVYAALSLFGPTGANTYHLSEAQLIELRLSILVPVHLIWLIAVGGAMSFRRYAGIIGDSPEAPGIRKMANGLLWTIGYIIFATILGAIVPFFANTRYFTAAIITRDHLTAWAALAAFIILYLGSSQLRTVAKFTTWTKETIGVLIVYGIFSSAFVLNFYTGSKAVTGIATNTSTDSVSLEVLIFTLILPYLAAWFLGLLACINIAKFSRQVNGTLYRSALRDLVRGILAVIGFAVVLQIITFATHFLVGWSLNEVLILLYGLLLLYSLGFLLVRSGAKKLITIEAAR